MGDMAALALLFAVTYFQYRYVWIYHDDYAYASLSYGLGKPIGEISPANILRYLGWHYTHIGGRILFFFFQISAMQLGVQGFMLVQSVTTCLLLFTLYKIGCLIRGVENTRQKALILLLLLSLYLLIRVAVYRDSSFWASAASLYGWPQLPLAMGVFLAYACAADARWRNKSVYVCVALCFFIAGFSQEQVALSAVAFMPAFALFVLGKEAGKYKGLLLSGLLPALAGMAVLYAAPGNYVRMAYKGEPMPGLYAVATRIPEKTCYIAAKVFDSWFGALLGLSLALMVLAALARPERRRAVIATLPLWVMALAAAAVFYVAPVKGPRMFFPTLIWALTAASPAFSLWEGRYGKVALVLAVALFSFAGYNYYQRVFSGYHANYATCVLNDANLRKAAKQVPPPESVTFYRLPRRRHSNAMPYHNRAYIETWIKNYYKLPPGTVLVYERSPYASKRAPQQQEPAPSNP